MFKQFIIFCLFPFLSFAQTQNNNKFAIIQNGIEASYQFKLGKADSLFFSYIAHFPNSPTGYHYLSQLHLWYYLGSRDEAERLIFEKYSSLALKKAKECIDTNSENPDSHFILGQIYTLRALGQIFQDKQISALFSSRNAVSEFEETLELDSTYYDAYYGIGLFNYVLSFVPRTYQWVISIAGLDADKDSGLQNMRVAYQHGNLMKTEAAFQLAQIYSDYAAQYDSSLILLNKLTSKFPKNIIFNYEKCVVLIKSHHLDSAKPLLSKISSVQSKQFSQTIALSNFQLGNIYFFQNKFKPAIDYYNKFLQQANSLDFTGIAHYRLAISYYFLNRKLKSKHELLMAVQGNQDIELDQYAKKMSVKLFDNWLSKQREKLIKCKNYLRTGNYQLVINSLNDSINVFKNQEIENTAKVYLADALIKIDSTDRAFGLLSQINPDSINTAKWLIPYSQLLFAEYYYLKLNYQKSNIYLKSAIDNNNYSLKNELAPQIINLKRKLSKQINTVKQQ